MWTYAQNHTFSEWVEVLHRRTMLQTTSTSGTSYCIHEVHSRLQQYISPHRIPPLHNTDAYQPTAIPYTHIYIQHLCWLLRIGNQQQIHFVISLLAWTFKQLYLSKITCGFRFWPLKNFVEKFHIRWTRRDAANGNKDEKKLPPAVEGEKDSKKQRRLRIKYNLFTWIWHIVPLIISHYWRHNHISTVNHHHWCTIIISLPSLPFPFITTPYFH